MTHNGKTDFYGVLAVTSQMVAGGEFFFIAIQIQCLDVGTEYFCTLLRHSSKQSCMKLSVVSKSVETVAV